MKIVLENMSKTELVRLIDGQNLRLKEQNLKLIGLKFKA
jgi:hypothetical protein